MIEEVRDGKSGTSNSWLESVLRSSSFRLASALLCQAGSFVLIATSWLLAAPVPFLTPLIDPAILGCM